MARAWFIKLKRRFIDMILDCDKFIEIRWEGTINIDKLCQGDYLLLVSRVSEGILGITKVIDLKIKKLRDVTDRESKLAGFSNPQELINELKKIYPIKDLDEKYYFIYVIPFLDLRLNPIRIEEFKIKITDQDLQGKIIEIDLDIVKRILLKKLKQFIRSD